MQRIQIVGLSGAGKTTLGRLIAGRFGLPLIDLDALYWEPGWVEVGHAELSRRLARQVSGDGWVVAGNYLRTTEPQLWSRLTQLVVLDLPLLLLLWRTVHRTVRRSLTGEPCCNGNHESLARVLHHDGVVRHLLRSWRDRRTRYAALADHPALAHMQVVHLRSRRAVRDFVAELRAAMPSAAA